MRRTLLFLMISMALSGCVNLAPDYQQPSAPVAAQWPSGKQGSGSANAQIEWKDFFIDGQLREVVKLSLDNNRDLRVAALNVEYQRAQYRIQRAELFPSLEASTSGTRERTTSGTSSGNTVSSQYGVDVGFSNYELDVFGRLRNLKDAALEDFLSTEQTQRSTQISLVAEVASDWLTLASDQQLLKLAKETYLSHEATYKLTVQRHEAGSDSGLSVSQAQSSMESARADVASYSSQVEQDINALNLLVGSDVPKHLLPGDGAMDVAVLVDVPAGLPSTLLQRRPDVVAAEHTLKAANADVGAARAAFYPSITLTANAGTSSSELSGLFKSGSRAWTFSPSISLPIFNAGSNKASLTAAEITKQIDVADYEKTLQTAFKEVADALAVRRHISEQMAAQKAATGATQKTYDLSLALYNQGSKSFLDVLDAQRSLYSAQQSLISLELSEQNNRVTLYKVLGGGWSG
ncbi:efflux transporter outer membrane subunit [Pseudomonas sp. FEN]|uniref:efflux transporter outer membrane subunit n=1 Tax=Pseudomonas sp. FEN TaxID=2767468 RepID=UPI00174B4FBA|nr:efflux transporter outer membrane subunit [Pseudomonas sp. FEN]